MNKAYGKALRAVRIRSDKSLGDVARYLDMSLSHYSKVENGRERPLCPLVVDHDELARFFGYEPDKFSTFRALLMTASDLAFKSLRRSEQERWVIDLLQARLTNESLTGDDLQRLRGILDDTT